MEANLRGRLESETIVTDQFRTLRAVAMAPLFEALRAWLMANAYAVARKNWLFSGSPGGAHASAGLYSLIETAKANGHEPYAYLCHLFATLPNCSTEAGREALLPYRLDPSSYKANAL